MSMRTTTGHFTFTDWQENAVTPDGQVPGLAHASVVNAYSGGIEAPKTTCEYLMTYRADKTGVFTGYQLLAGSLDGRDGSFVVVERGEFTADNTVVCTFDVVPGSGTGALVGLRGSGAYTAEHGGSSTPYTFEYELDE